MVIFLLILFLIGLVIDYWYCEYFDENKFVIILVIIVFG